MSLRLKVACVSRWSEYFPAEQKADVLCVCVCVFVCQAKFDTMKKQMESMEMEVMEARLIRASELNGEMDDDDTGEFVMSLPGQSKFGIERTV